MDKVKIKRVKRNKKKITTAEKVMAGIGVGSTLMGGAMAGVAKPGQSTQFVRTNETGSTSGTTQKIKTELGKIFGSTLGVGVAKADDSATQISDAQVQAAIASGDPSQVQALLNQGYNPNLMSTDSMAALSNYAQSNSAALPSTLTGGSLLAYMAGAGADAAPTADTAALGYAIGPNGNLVLGDNSSVTGGSATGGGSSASAGTGSGQGTATGSAASGAASSSSGATGSGATGASQTVTLSASNVNLTPYDPSLLPQINNNLLTSAQLAAYQAGGVAPGSVLAYMLGLGNPSLGPNQSMKDPSGNTYVMQNGLLMLQIPQAPLTAANANSTPYDPALNSQIAALTITSYPSTITPGSVLAYKLGLGDSNPASGTKAVGTDQNIYSYNGSQWVNQGSDSTPNTPAISNNPLNVGNLNTTPYTTALSGDITSLNLTTAQKQSLPTTGVVPGNVLAYMLGLGGDSPASGTARVGTDGNIYTFNGATWSSQQVAVTSSSTQTPGGGGASQTQVGTLSSNTGSGGAGTKAVTQTGNTTLSLSSQNLNLQVNGQATVKASVVTNGQTDYNISAVADSGSISVAVDTTTGNITVTGLATTGSTPATITVHPNDLAASDTSQDQTITVNVSGAVMADASTGGGGGSGGASAVVAPGFMTTSLPNGTVGQIYTGAIRVASYSSVGFSLASGTLPPALTLDGSNGHIDGQLTTPGTYTFAITATNQQGSTTQEFTITVTGSGGGTVSGQSLETELTDLNATPGFVGLQMQNPGLQMPPGYPASGGNTGQVAAAQVSGQSYTVKKGDTLSSISKQFYGSGDNWRKILSANPNCLSIPGNTKTLKIGAQLVIPNIN